MIQLSFLIIVCDDTIIISDHRVTVRAGDGDDSISMSGYAYATIYGDAGNDRITISSQNSSRARIFGGDGDDILSLAGYTNYIDMGNGNDTVTGEMETIRLQQHLYRVVIVL